MAEQPQTQLVANFVEAAALMLALPIPAGRMPAVTSVMTRIADFAANVAAVELANDIEVAGTFVP